MFLLLQFWRSTLNCTVGFEYRDIDIIFPYCPALACGVLVCMLTLTAFHILLAWTRINDRTTTRQYYYYYFFLLFFFLNERKNSCVFVCFKIVSLAFSLGFHFKETKRTPRLNFTKIWPHFYPFIICFICKAFKISEYSMLVCVRMCVYRNVHQSITVYNSWDWYTNIGKLYFHAVFYIFAHPPKHVARSRLLVFLVALCRPFMP